jgi:two-component system cell cycle sensor histidine kinase/response regulator CckA
LAPVGPSSKPPPQDRRPFSVDEDVTRTVTGDATSRISALDHQSLLAGASGETQPRLVVLTGHEQGRRFPLDGPVVIGRGDECDVQLDDGKVSRRHARVLPSADGEVWVVEDVGSRNGTLVNGELVSGRRPLELGDRIQLSQETMLLFTRQDPLEEILLHRQQMEVIGQLAAGIAHDFNNLLNVVIASTAHLRDLPPETPLRDDTVRECRNDIETAARRAAELTGRLLGIARRRRERSRRGQMEAVDVSQLCRDVLQLCRRTFDRSIDVVDAVAPGLVVLGDSSALHQVLMNLCINARDAMPKGGRLELYAARTTIDGAPQVILEVRDSGVGMDEKTQARVFEPFFTTKAQEAGSGLGLATVYEVATGHGGVVEVDSTPGRGSIFRVRLPSRDTLRAPRPTPMTTRPIRKTSEDIRPGRVTGHVLVVDDQELVRRSLARLVRAAGHVVTCAADGREAMAVYFTAERRPDVILLDLDMPNLTGDETLSQVLELDPTAKVVLISGYHDEARRRSLLDAGAVEFLPKPVDAAHLRETLVEAMSGG